MSDYLTDLSYMMDPTRYASNTQKTNNDFLLDNAPKEESKSNTDLTFEDMLLLMVTQLQNQTIDNQADTNDMMNQLIQMTVMQALTEMSVQVEDLTNANVMSYSASLVGKEVTVGVVDPKTGKLASEIVGTVTATGTYNGQQVIFIGDKYYPLSSIMAVGKLPEEAVDGSTTKPVTKPDESGDDTEGDDKVDGSGEAGGDDNDTTVENPNDTDADIDESEALEENGADVTPQLPVED